jgi:hypothetical protein
MLTLKQTSVVLTQMGSSPVLRTVPEFRLTRLKAMKSLFAKSEDRGLRDSCSSVVLSRGYAMPCAVPSMSD